MDTVVHCMTYFTSPCKDANTHFSYKSQRKVSKSCCWMQIEFGSSSTTSQEQIFVSVFVLRKGLCLIFADLSHSKILQTRERGTLERESGGKIKSVPGFYILQLWHTCCWEIHAIQLYHSELLSYRSSFAVLSWRKKKYMWRLPPKAWFQHFRFMKLTEPDIKVLCSIYMLWLRPHTYLHGKKSARK